MIKRDRKEASGVVLACTPMRHQWASNGDAWDSDARDSVAGLLGLQAATCEALNVGSGRRWVAQRSPYNQDVVRVRRQGSWFL